MRRRPGCDPDLIARGLEPITDVERAGMARLSAVDVELLTHKLSAIVEEARDVYMALSISEGIITGDMNCGLFTASGDPVVVGTGIYFHTLLNNAQLKYINKYYRDDPSVGLRDGDIYFFNEELAGGVHNMDMFTAMPIFWQGELVAWAECGGHQGETGSITPGGFAPTARSRYEEGLHIPCMRIGENFVLRRDVLDFMTGSVRNSFVFEADLRSRVATMMRIRDRFLREIERKGVEYRRRRHAPDPGQGRARCARAAATRSTTASSARCCSTTITAPSSGSPACRSRSSRKATSWRSWCRASRRSARPARSIRAGTSPARRPRSTCSHISTAACCRPMPACSSRCATTSRGRP